VRQCDRLPAGESASGQHCRAPADRDAWDTTRERRHAAVSVPGRRASAERGRRCLARSGLSARKIATLRRSGEALVSGALDAAMLEERPSHDAAALLQQLKGIGPWTATVILLRGLGRLDVFPMNDTSVAHNIALVAGDEPLDVAGILGALSPQQGMLYYHLLLARLEARGEVGRASVL